MASIPLIEALKNELFSNLRTSKNYLFARLEQSLKVKSSAVLRVKTGGRNSESKR